MTNTDLRGGGAMEHDEFDHFRQFLRDACGIALADNKKYLVSTRIRRILSDNDLASITDLIEALQNRRHSGLRNLVIDAMTTNETFWFRDSYPFEFLKNTLLPELDKDPDGRGEIRIWCTACSSGQEPYSVSIAAEEYRRSLFGGMRKNLRIVATDLSSSMLSVAADAVYDNLSIARGLSKERLQRFFQPVGENKWHVNAEIRQRVEYQVLNMLDSYAGLGQFEVIFCRNVLIYFANDLKQSVLRRLHASLRPRGYLCLGSSEGLGDSAHLFEMVHCNPGIMYRAR